MKLFQKVFLHGVYGDSQRTGKVVGSGSFIRERFNLENGKEIPSHELRQCLIVELDEGFYSEDKKTWTLHVLVDESNVEVIP